MKRKLHSLKEPAMPSLGEENDSPLASFQEIVTCPISLQLMKDPVVLHPSGITYDRESLCQALLYSPTREPSTNQSYTEKLTYSSNYSVRSVLTRLYGEDAYDPYDDTCFLCCQYEAAWQTEMLKKLEEGDFIPSDALHKFADQGIAAAQYRLGENCMEKHMDATSSKFSEQPLLAFAWFQAAAENGHCKAQFNLGKMYRLGSKTAGVQEDLNMALGWLEKAATSGLIEAQCELAEFYTEGLHDKDGKPDFQQAFWWYEQAAELDDAFAQLKLGLAYLIEEKWMPKDTTLAASWLLKAARNGQVEARDHLFDIFCNEKHSLDEQVERPVEREVLRWFEAVASQGCRETQYKLASILSNTAYKSEHMSFYWYKQAAQQGHCLAQFQVGVAYRTGTGVKQNEKKAVDWWKRSAGNSSLNCAHAEFCLGNAYQKGLGVVKDEKLALEWFLKAAHGGIAEAQMIYGLACRNGGPGVAQNSKDALAWLTKAAGKNHAKAQLLLGEIYQQGEGTTADVNVARRWYLRAAKQGSVSAKYALHTLGSLLPACCVVGGGNLQCADYRPRRLGKTSKDSNVSCLARSLPTNLSGVRD